jgi:hypothetical protein
MRVAKGWWVVALLIATPVWADEIGASRLALDRTSPEISLWAKGAAEPATPRHPLGLSAERARILLQSLTVPGWGQATLGRRTSATVFSLAETGVWASFVSFRIQESMRRRSYEKTAMLFAGIDLEGRDDEFRRIVGIYPSSDEYNRLVVYRDAANLYLRDPEHFDLDAYHEYITKHSLKGSDTWAWDSYDSYARYGEQRKQTRRAALRANSMLGLAIANRLLSAIHAARYAGRATPPPRSHSWRFDCGPAPGDPLAMRLGVSLRY